MWLCAFEEGSEEIRGETTDDEEANEARPLEKGDGNLVSLVGGTRARRPLDLLLNISGRWGVRRRVWRGWCPWPRSCCWRRRPRLGMPRFQRETLRVPRHSNAANKKSRWSKKKSLIARFCSRCPCLPLRWQLRRRRQRRVRVLRPRVGRVRARAPLISLCNARDRPIRRR